MADITLSYKGSTIAEVSASGTTKLNTKGKYCEDDITLQYVKPSGGGSYIGGTVAWNQLISTLRASTTVYDLTLTNNNNKSLTISGTANNSGNVSLANAISCVANHKYLVSCGANGITGARVSFRGLCPIGKSAFIVNASSSSNVTPSLNVASGTVINMELVLCIFDLTVMFGSTIADYVYTLESGTAGAGIAWLKANGFFNSAYYPYDAGTLKSVETFAHPFKDSNGKIIGYFPMNFDLELRGIPKLDANNVLYYDGDEYDGNGTVTRKCGVRAYTSGDATDGSTMITDGTNTVYKLATPTTETV